MFDGNTGLRVESIGGDAAEAAGPLREHGLDQSAGDQGLESSIGDVDANATSSSIQSLPSWLNDVRVGYDRGFLIASGVAPDDDLSEAPFLLRLNGLGQLRATHFDSQSDNPDLNQFQLIRGRLAFSGHALTPDLRYFVQLDGRSSAGDEFRLLDYIIEFDAGRHWLDWDRNALIFKAGRYKVPFTFARFMSAREFQFTDRSVASMFFDLNRSLGWGLGGQTEFGRVPLEWEACLFNGFVTGGAETGSAGSLDNNLAHCGGFLRFLRAIGALARWRISTGMKPWRRVSAPGTRARQMTGEVSPNST